MTIGVGPTKGVQEYWAQVSNDSGRTKGPIHLVIKTLRECGVEPITPTVWQVPLVGNVDTLAHPDYPTFARQLSVDAI